MMKKKNAQKKLTKEKLIMSMMHERSDEMLDQDPDLDPDHDQDQEIEIMFITEETKEELELKKKQRIR